MSTGRPIVSDYMSESYGAATFIDFHLKSLSTRHNLKYTYHFLNRKENIKVALGGRFIILRLGEA